MLAASEFSHSPRRAAVSDRPSILPVGVRRWQTVFDQPLRESGDWLTVAPCATSGN
jgi:hypothetical protein